MYKRQTYDHVVKFEDPDFLYTLATVQLGGRLTLRLANADVLPLRVDNFTRTVTKYASEVKKLAGDLRTQTAARNALIQSGAMQLAADPRQTFIQPKPREPVPFLNFAPLENALTRLDAATRAFTALDLSQLSPEKAKALDAILMRTERVLTRPEGLPRRPWFRHMIYAPGFYTGYGVKTLPGIREALEQRFWQEAGEQIGYTANALEAFAAEVERAAKVTSN